MSHQSGITGTDELSQQVSETVTSTSARMLKIVIEDEKLKIAATEESQGDWENDWDNYVLSNVDEDKPCYLLYRLDTQNNSGYDFVFIAWSPDFAHIRQKMLYASTRATFKQLVGSTYIKDELFGTVKADVSLEGYKKHLVAEAAPPPMTDEEIEKREIQEAETGAHIGASTKKSVATGVAFPLSQDAISALEKLGAGKVNYVQLSLDTSSEIINLEQSSSVEADGIAKTVPSDSPRYLVFAFKHNHEGDSMTSTFFVYCCPGYSCSVKERMLYSTCKAPLVDAIEEVLGNPLDKKSEVGEGSELTYDFFYDSIHPPKQVGKAKFSRPARPGRGARRLIKDKQ